ncbi:MAG: hypothetical protein RR766_06060 [Longicatena sp.]|jgi:hypothetical protein|uniref:hypothetical protein n=1 Tax=Anaerorhabdus sp. TaxID=1872524 RepID=UPI002FC68C4F
MAKTVNLPEFVELKQVIEKRDELRFGIAASELFEVVQNSNLKPEKKLIIYDLISKLSNCHEQERPKYLKKIGKCIK